MLTKRPKRQYECEIVNLEDMIPQDHFLRVIEKYFDWNFIYEEVEKQYSVFGRPSIDPVVLFKVHILKFLFHEDSLRRTYENLKYNNLYRWFIGYNLNEAVPDHSTYSQNYKRKFCKLEKDILQTVFDKVIELLIDYDCLDMTAVYIDSTHTKAYANKKKNHKEVVQIEAKKYQKELELEISLKGLKEEDFTDEEFLEEIEKEARKNYVPIIRKETQNLLKLLLAMNRPKRILEVGTAVGFSALLMEEYNPVACKITTIENYEKRIPIARQNFLSAGKQNVIELLEGDASEVLKTLQEPYDFIFMDAAKGQYINFLPEVMRLLKTGGVLVSDNVLQDGDIIESRFAVTRRDRTIHKRMRDYLYEITHMEELMTSVLPVGDGVTISVKKEGNKV